MNFEHAHFFLAGAQVRHHFLHRLGARTHEHDHALGIGRAHIVEQAVMTPGQFGEAVHRLLDDGRAGKVGGIDALTRLEVRIGIVSGAANEGMIGRERSLPVRRSPVYRRS